MFSNKVNLDYLLGAVLYKILSKSISITNCKIHFKEYFNYFCQLLWTSGPKYKILL